MKIKRIFLVYMKPEGRFTKQVCNYLSSTGRHCTISLRDKLSGKIKNADLVITIGGDGTFLKTAHHVYDIPILGINAEPGMKEGFFTCCHKYNYKKKLKAVLEGKYKILDLLRLEGRLNNKKLPIALNEYFIGCKKPYHMSEYYLKIRNKRELQRTSGLLIGTPAGSYAWIKSAHGKNMSLASRNYQFVAREPYHGNLVKQRILKGILRHNEKVQVVSKMPRGMVVVDSLPKEYKFSYGDKLIVGASKHMLKLVM